MWQRQGGRGGEPALLEGRLHATRHRLPELGPAAARGANSERAGCGLPVACCHDCGLRALQWLAITGRGHYPDSSKNSQYSQVSHSSWDRPSVSAKGDRARGFTECCIKCRDIRCMTSLCSPSNLAGKSSGCVLLSHWHCRKIIFVPYPFLEYWVQQIQCWRRIRGSVLISCLNTSCHILIEFFPTSACSEYVSSL